MNRSLPSLVIESCERNQDKLFLIDGSHEYTYKDLLALTESALSLLDKNGVHKGDRIVLCLDNSINYISYYLALLMRGAVVVPINKLLQLQEVEKVINDSGASLLISNAQNLKENIDIKYLDSETIFDENDAKVDINAFSLLSDVLLSDSAAIIYTSGTTGDPKGVVLTHGNLVANTLAINKYLPITQSDKTLAVLPFCYSYGLSVLNTHLINAACIVISRVNQFPAKVLQLILEQQITSISAVASFFNLLIHKTNIINEKPISIRYVTNAGGPISEHLVQDIGKSFPLAKIFLMYGQTEATARITYLPSEKLFDKIKSAGLPLDGVSIEIRNKDGAVLSANQIGEVYVKGPNVMKGYWGNESATAEVLKKEWLRTGDIGYLDEDGYLFLEGRKSDILKINSYRISPFEIESAINEIPEVLESAVIGSSDPSLGDIIVAFVVTEHSIDERIIKKYCAERLSSFKRPRVINFIDELPKTSSGKIKKNILKGM